MKINTYLPDRIGEEAKAKGLNLSRLLRDAVTTELRWQQAEDEGKVETYIAPVLLEDDSGEQIEVIARITGRRLYHDEDASFYAVEDERAIIVWGDNTMNRYENPADALAAIAEPLLASGELSAYVGLCRRLGVKPVIDL